MLGRASGPLVCYAVRARPGRYRRHVGSLQFLRVAAEELFAVVPVHLDAGRRLAVAQRSGHLGPDAERHEVGARSSSNDPTGRGGDASGRCCLGPILLKPDVSRVPFVVIGIGSRPRRVGLCAFEHVAQSFDASGVPIRRFDGIDNQDTQ